MTDETETRTLEDVSFEAYQMATIALERHADRAGDESEEERAEGAKAELVGAWNDANERQRGEDDGE